MPIDGKEQGLLTFREHIRASPLFWVFYTLLISGGVVAFVASIYNGTLYHSAIVFARDPLIMGAFLGATFALIIGTGFVSKMPRSTILGILALLALFVAQFPIGYVLTLLLV